MIRARALVLALAGALACTATSPSPSPSLSASPSPSAGEVPSTPSTSPAAGAVRFRVARARSLVEQLAALGPREAASATYARAASIVEERLASFGYRVRRQHFALPAGVEDGASVAAGRSFNVIAEPPGYRPGRPHLVIGGHLDSVPDSPGANDNASGIAVGVEAARLAAAATTKLPIVFVAFGAEERRRQSADASVFAVGSRTYLARLSRAERAGIVGAVNLDMVGNGPRVLLLGSGDVYAFAFRAARVEDIPVAPWSTALFSDSASFEDAGIPVVWLWSGEHPTLHEPTDVASVVRPGALRRAGALAWRILRTYRP